jgi:hypothetical protein
MIDITIFLQRIIIGVAQLALLFFLLCLMKKYLKECIVQELEAAFEERSKKQNDSKGSS